MVDTHAKVSKHTPLALRRRLRRRRSAPHGRLDLNDAEAEVNMTLRNGSGGGPRYRELFGVGSLEVYWSSGRLLECGLGSCASETKCGNVLTLVFVCLYVSGTRVGNEQ